MNKLNFKLPKLKLKPRAKPVALSLYFGIPGAGKSTYAAYLAKKDMKRGRKVWSNFGKSSAHTGFMPRKLLYRAFSVWYLHSSLWYFFVNPAKTS